MKQTPVKVSFDNVIGEFWSWHIPSIAAADSGHMTLESAVWSFEKFCYLVDARAVFEFVGPAKVEAHRLLTS